ncbi:MAG TPA: hypothetical protein VMV44_09420 [Rectinemataceae bacterium]|nr:hypothetical protein [Rectinemataceae bacterium]
MKLGNLLNQHIVVSAFLALLAASIALFPFSGEHPLVFFSFGIIVSATVLFLVTILPLILMEGLFSLFHKRASPPLGLPLKWIVTLLVCFASAFIFSLIDAGSSATSFTAQTRGGIYVASMVAGLVFRIFRFRRTSLG